MKMIKHENRKRFRRLSVKKTIEQKKGRYEYWYDCDDFEDAGDHWSGTKPAKFNAFYRLEYKGRLYNIVFSSCKNIEGEQFSWVCKPAKQIIG